MAPSGSARKTNLVDLKKSSTKYSSIFRKSAQFEKILDQPLLIPDCNALAYHKGNYRKGNKCSKNRIYFRAHSTSSNAKECCQKHSNYQLEFYCYECKIEICGNCWDEDHGNVASHRVQRVDHAKKSILTENLQNINFGQRENEARKRIAKVQGTILLLEDLMRSMTREYTHLVQEMITCEDVLKLSQSEFHAFLESEISPSNQLQNQIIEMQRPGSLTGWNISENDTAKSFEIYRRMQQLTSNSNSSDDSGPSSMTWSSYFENMMDKVRSNIHKN